MPLDRLRDPVESVADFSEQASHTAFRRVRTQSADEQAEREPAADRDEQGSRGIFAGEIPELGGAFVGGIGWCIHGLDFGFFFAGADFPGLQQTEEEQGRADQCEGHGPQCSEDRTDRQHIQEKASAYRGGDGLNGFLACKFLSLRNPCRWTTATHVAYFGASIGPIIAGISLMFF